MSITFSFAYRRLWVRVETISEPATTEPVEGPDARPARLIRFGAVERSVASYQRLLEDIVADLDDELADLDAKGEPS